ncbi:MAG: hypothetical protein NZ849_04525 [Meiothermus sp.]|uniref:hypothetical protein n=1 Tax=Meiothermus sp. TaxID=1955249 RepID=UPI0025EF77A0|nr:hypothetical protein [Meiothermus sp.]MCS7059033.1 hypothetical protein [Meiothermus sp.]MCS7194164.1 hypothetical protein [Meiothermus sp.]MCX7740628.1 hypothetical protein [Meiothermus sp.]MDW8090025.1 hypothetical protein [Meiothermus sp.]MDW8480674.1 hypothetical protein [Meiothermus sp.]
MARWLALGLLGLSLFLVLGGWAAYVFLVRPAQNLVNELRQVIVMDQGVKNQSPYRPPADDRLSKEQVEQLLRVQRQVKQGLGERYQRIAARLDQLARQQVGQFTLDYRTALDLFRDSSALIVEAKRLQVEALNQEGLSPEEYAWIKRQVYSALGLGLPQLDPSEVLRQIGAGDFNPRVEMERPQASSDNEKLVEPHREELLSYYPFTWFGL